MTQQSSLETQFELAVRLVRQLFATRERITIAEAVELGQAHGVSRRTLIRASRSLGVREVHNGPKPAFWEMQRLVNADKVVAA